MDSLKDKVVIVTGSSDGIGAVTAVEFARLGSKVVITGRNVEKLNKTQQKCEDLNTAKDQFLVVPGDMKVDDDIKKIVEQTVERFGQIDVLVNNAGIIKNGTVEQITMSDFDEIFDVNVKGVIKITQLCIPYLKKSKGNIVNMSSQSSQSPGPIASCYCMSKAALDMFTKLLVIELSPDGVRVNSVNPSIIKTSIFNDLGSDLDVNGLLREKAKTYPMGRVGEPIEVARVVTFLASDAAGFMTGNFTLVDGGLMTTTAANNDEIQRDPCKSDDQN